jgi:hypothetical protein
MSGDELLRLLPWLIASATTGACAAATVKWWRLLRRVAKIHAALTRVGWKYETWAQNTRSFVTAELYRSFAQELRSFARQVRE